MDDHCPHWKAAAVVARKLQETLGQYGGPIYFNQPAGCRNGLVFQRSKKGMTVNWFQPSLPLYLLVALAFNVICASILAAVALKGIRGWVLPFISKKVAERTAEIHASQRLQNSGPVDELDIKADFLHYPERGINLSWQRPAEAFQATFFRISCVCTGSTRRVAIDVPASDLMQLGPSKCQYFLTLAQAGLEHVLEDVVLQVSAMSAAKSLCRTSWSVPVRVHPLRGVAHIPWDVLSILRGPSQAHASLPAFLRTMCSRFTPPGLTLVLDSLHLAGDKEDFSEPLFLELFLGEQKETARMATAQGKEESHFSTRLIRTEELNKSSSAKGWNGNDYFGIDILPESGPWQLTPPFRDGLRFGAVLRVRVLSVQDSLIASGHVDWNELLDAYADTHQFGFSKQVDLIDADGDFIGALCMRPAFKSEILDAMALTSQASKDNWFQDDVPGDIYLQGVDRFVNWTSDRPKEDDVEQWMCNFWLEQADTSSLQLVARDLRFVSETFPWVVDADFSQSSAVCCRILMEKVVGPQNGEPMQPKKDDVLCTSNWFVAIETLHLGELEQAYAAFCRMNHIEMAGMNPLMLASCGIATRQVSVRGCSDLRRPLPFEDMQSDILRCAGGLILTGISHSMLNSHGEEVARCRVRSNSVTAVDGLRLRKSRMAWRPTEVLGEQLGMAGMAVEGSRLPVATALLTLAEAFGTLALHVWQAASFLLLPMLAALLLKVYAFFSTQAAASDPLESSTLLEQNVGSLSSSFGVLASVFALVVVMCLVVANALSGWSNRLVILADTVLSAVSFCGAALAFMLLFTMMLLFLIGALLDPMTALQPLVVGAAGFGLVASMWQQFLTISKGIVQVIESQLDLVLNMTLDNLINRLGLDKQNLALGSDYTMEDLHFTLQRADRRFRGQDAEGNPLHEGNKRVTKDDFVDEIAKLTASRGAQGAQETSNNDGLDGVFLDLPDERRTQLSQLFQYYLQKTPLEDDLQWRIFEECDVLTDVLIQQHQNRLQLLDFEGVEAVGSQEPQMGDQDPQPSLPKLLPKAYLIYRSIYRDHIDKITDLIVRWADPMLHWDSMVDKVTKFYDDAVPKYVRSCAMSSFNPNIRDSISQQVLAAVYQHVEQLPSASATATITLDELIHAMQGHGSWASGLLEMSHISGTYDEPSARAFIKEHVKQAVPDYRTMAPHIPIKLPEVFEKLIKGRIWWPW